MSKIKKSESHEGGKGNGIKAMYSIDGSLVKWKYDSQGDIIKIIVNSPEETFFIKEK